MNMEDWLKKEFIVPRFSKEQQELLDNPNKRIFYGIDWGLGPSYTEWFESVMSKVNSNLDIHDETSEVTSEQWNPIEMELVDGIWKRKA